MSISRGSPETEGPKLALKLDSFDRPARSNILRRPRLVGARFPPLRDRGHSRRVRVDLGRNQEDAQGHS